MISKREEDRLTDEMIRRNNEPIRLKDTVIAWTVFYGVFAILMVVLVKAAEWVYLTVRF